MIFPKVELRNQEIAERMAMQLIMEYGYGVTFLSPLNDNYHELERNYHGYKLPYSFEDEFITSAVMLRKNREYIMNLPYRQRILDDIELGIIISDYVLKNIKELLWHSDDNDDNDDNDENDEYHEQDYTNKNHTHDKFDLIILDYDYSDATIGLGQHYGAPVVLVAIDGDTTVINDLMGINAESSYIPHPYLAEFLHDYSPKYKMNSFERLTNMLLYHMERFYLSSRHYPAQAKIFNKYFPKSKFSFYDAMYHINAIFIYSDIQYSYPKPLLPNVMFDMGQWGFTNKRTTATTSTELVETFIKSAKEISIIFVSLNDVGGKFMTPSQLLRIFAKTHLYFIWRCEQIPTLNVPDNIFIDPGLEESVILSYPEVKAFMTTGDVKSINNAIINEKPIIGFGITIPQKVRITRAFQQGWAIQITVPYVSELLFTALCFTILIDEKFTNNVKKQRILMEDRQKNEVEKKLYFNIQRVIRQTQDYPDDFMSAKPNRNLKMNNHYDLELIIIAVVSGVMTLILSYIFCRLCCHSRNDRSISSRLTTIVRVERISYINDSLLIDTDSEFKRDTTTGRSSSNTDRTINQNVEINIEPDDPLNSIHEINIAAERPSPPPLPPPIQEIPQSSSSSLESRPLLLQPSLSPQSDPAIIETYSGSMSAKVSHTSASSILDLSPLRKLNTALEIIQDVIDTAHGKPMVKPMAWFQDEKIPIEKNIEPNLDTSEIGEASGVSRQSEIVLPQVTISDTDQENIDNLNSIEPVVDPVRPSSRNVYDILELQSNQQENLETQMVQPRVEDVADFEIAVLPESHHPENIDSNLADISTSELKMVHQETQMVQPRVEDVADSEIAVFPESHHPEIIDSNLGDTSTSELKTIHQETQNIQISAEDSEVVELSQSHHQENLDLNLAETSETSELKTIHQETQILQPSAEDVTNSDLVKLSESYHQENVESNLAETSTTSTISETQIVQPSAEDVPDSDVAKLSESHHQESVDPNIEKKSPKFIDEKSIQSPAKELATFDDAKLPESHQEENLEFDVKKIRATEEEKDSLSLPHYEHSLDLNLAETSTTPELQKIHQQTQILQQSAEDVTDSDLVKLSESHHQENVESNLAETSTISETRIVQPSAEDVPHSDVAKLSESHHQESVEPNIEKKSTKFIDLKPTQSPTEEITTSDDAKLPESHQEENLEFDVKKIKDSSSLPHHEHSLDRLSIEEKENDEKSDSDDESDPLDQAKLSTGQTLAVIDNITQPESKIDQQQKKTSYDEVDKVKDSSQSLLQLVEPEEITDIYDELIIQLTIRLILIEIMREQSLNREQNIPIPQSDIFLSEIQITDAQTNDDIVGGAVKLVDEDDGEGDDEDEDNDDDNDDHDGDDSAGGVGAGGSGTGGGTTGYNEAGGTDVGSSGSGDGGATGSRDAADGGDVTGGIDVTDGAATATGDSVKRRGGSALYLALPTGGNRDSGTSVEESTSEQTEMSSVDSRHDENSQSSNTTSGVSSAGVIDEHFFMHIVGDPIIGADILPENQDLQLINRISSDSEVD